MKKLLFILILLIYCTFSVQESAAAEHELTDNKLTKNKPTENHLQIRFGYNQLKDTYLSPLLYSGLSLGIENEWWNTYRTTDIIENRGYLSGTVNLLNNNQYSNSITSLNLSAGWGPYYQFRYKGLSLNIGPTLQTDLRIKQIAKNVNKPVNVDLGIDLAAFYKVGYSWRAKKTSYRICYLGTINLIGMNFAPDYWESYYGINKNLGKNLFASYWGRKINLKHEANLAMQFIYSTWKIGIRHEWENYTHQGLWFTQQNFSIVIGTIFHYTINGKVELH